MMNKPDTFPSPVSGLLDDRMWESIDNEGNTHMVKLADSYA